MSQDAAVCRIDIWLTALSWIDEERQHAYKRLLSPTEQAKWQTFVAPNPRLQYLVARALLRTALADGTGVCAKAWRFETNRYGKPFIREPKSFQNIQFNLSHTDGLIACAVSHGCSVGVDVENIDRKIDFDALIESVFSSTEKSRFQQYPSEQRQHRFFTCWTLKEAYVKARGLGLSLPLDGFWFDLDGAAPRIHFSDKCPDDPQRWYFRQYQPTPVHRLALAACDADNEIDVNVRWTIPLAPVEAPV